VALGSEQGYSVLKVVQDWGVAANIRFRWKESFENQKISITLPKDEQTEYTSLRQDTKYFNMDKEFVKKLCKKAFK
jgi:transposase-like protein